MLVEFRSGDIGCLCLIGISSARRGRTFHEGAHGFCSVFKLIFREADSLRHQVRALY